MEWSQGVAHLLPGEVVVIDGKTLRRSHDTRAGKGALHLVSAWASANMLTLGQVRTEEKSNEITAIPRLLELLDLKGCTIRVTRPLTPWAARKRLPRVFWSREPTTSWR